MRPSRLMYRDNSGSQHPFWPRTRFPSCPLDTPIYFSQTRLAHTYHRYRRVFPLHLNFLWLRATMTLPQRNAIEMAATDERGDRRALIALLGVTGAGKTTFARLASGNQELRVGNSIYPCLSISTWLCFTNSFSYLPCLNHPGSLTNSLLVTQRHTRPAGRHLYLGRSPSPFDRHPGLRRR
jgi:hypothetical protein